MKRLIAPLLAGSLVLLVGCNGGGGFSKRTQADNAGVFRYPDPSNPTTLDPGKVQDGDTIDLLQQTFEGLVGWGTDNTPQPNLAERWDVSPDGKTYTFHLKKGVKYFNGDEVVASDFKYSIERACDPALKSPIAGNYLNDIVGAQDMIDGKADSVKGIRVVDPLTLEITLEAPRPYFLGKLTYPCAFAVDPKVVKKGREITTPAGMMGTGPFKVVQFNPHQSVIMEAFEGYHGGAPKLKRIERPIIEDGATRLNKYKNGELDLVQLARQDLVGLQQDTKFKDQIKYFNRPALWYVAMNSSMKPFGDRKVRQAIAMAIDKQKIVNDLLGGVNQVANSILPPGVLGFRENANAIVYNPDQARKLLADAGYPNGQGVPPLEMFYRSGMPDVAIVAEAVASQLKENLGLTVKLRMLEWGAYLDMYNKKQIPFLHMRWAADYLDPQNFLSLLLASYGTENKINYRNPQYDAICRQADAMQDQTKRLQLYAQAEDMVLQDAPFVPIYFQRDAELISPRVSGLRESLFGHLPHTTVELK